MKCIVTKTSLNNLKVGELDRTKKREQGVLDIGAQEDTSDKM